MLEVKDITFSFDKKEKKPLIQNLSFKVKKDEILFVSGKSGLGKSTLLDLISGFHDDNLIWKGKIYLNKLDITNASIQNKKIGYMLQDYFLFPHFNVKNNLIFSLPKETKNKKEHVLHFLKQVDMIEFSNHYPSELSGGQKARVACLRAILSYPDALLLDEPFSALDKKTMKSFQKFLFDFVSELKIPCIIVSHRLIKNLDNCKELDITKFT